MELNRRAFLGTAAAAATTLRLGGQGRTIRIGLIGCGWWGRIDLKAALEVGGCEALAVCDVDSERLSQTASEVAAIQGKSPRVFKNFQELLAEPDLDAVIIATPPHWHALQFIEAVGRGLDVYCEKPLSYDVREGQAMVEAARRAGRVVQIGFQRRQSDAVRQAGDFIESGGAGTIVQVDAHIHYTAESRDTTVQDPPVSLDWDAWCGPAPLLPYRPSIGHFAWRLEAAYGNGHLVDWGIHWIDAVRNTLRLGMPRFIQASGGIYRLGDVITTPDTLTVHFEYDRCPVVWRHRLWGAAELGPETSNGMVFFGEKATVFVTDNHWEVIPTAKDGRRERHEAAPDRGFIQRHMADFLDAVRNRRQPACTVEDAFQSTAAVQLAMIAYRTGSRVEWDAARGSIRNNAAAEALLKRDYRAPWRHPADQI